MSVITVIPSELTKQYPDYKLVVSGNGHKITAIIVNPEFTTSVAVQTSNIADDIAGTLGALSSKFKAVTDAIQQADDKSSLSPYMSLKRWKGSRNNDFSIEFYVLEKGREAELALNSMVLPTTKNGFYVYEPMSLTGSMMDLIKNPNTDLKSFLAKQKDKLFTVQVGNWFYAKYLLCTNLTINRKINVNVDGRPAYMRVQMQFEPIMDLTRDEINGWSIL